MATEEDKLAQFASITGANLNQASFFLESAGGDVEAAVAAYFDNPERNDDATVAAPANQGTPAALGAPTATTSSRPATNAASRATGGRGAYTLSGAPVEALPAGWGTTTSSPSTSRSATPSNPLRSNTGPRVTGFRDLAAASTGPPAGGSRGGFGSLSGLGGGGDDDSDDEGGRDPATFFTGGAKSGLSVENPEDRRGGGMADMVRNILNQAREGSRRLAGGEDEQPRASSSRFFGGSAHTLGSDESPSTYISDPTAKDVEEQEDEEEEVAIRHLTFWQDGFSIEDGDLMDYDEHRELLAAIQSGRAPLSLLRVKHDQPVQLRIAERRGEKWVRQPPPPQGPFAGTGNRLGSESPFPSSSSSRVSAPNATMPGSLPMHSSGADSASVPKPAEVKFEVDRSQPTTQLQIRLRNGDRMVATFNQTHTVGDIRSYINASRPGEAGMPYVLQTTFPTKDLVDDNATLKDAGLLGSVIVQRPA